MLVSEAYITRKVHIVMDDIGVNDADFLTDRDNDNLNTIIISKVEEAAKNVYKSAAVRLIKPLNIDNPLSINEELVGTIRLPSDYLRLISIKLSCWDYEPGSIIDAQSLEYHKQRNKYCRGTFERPVIAVGRDSDGEYLELFSAQSGESKIERALYIPIPKWIVKDMQRWIDIQELLEEALIYEIAGLVLTTYRDEQAANMLLLSKGNSESLNVN